MAALKLSIFSVNDVRVAERLWASCIKASALSPVAPTGVIAVDLMGRIGLLGVGWQNYAQCLLAHALVGFGGYLSRAACASCAPDRAPSSSRACRPCLPPAGCRWSCATA